MKNRNRRVLLDRHMRTASAYTGNSHDQIKEFERVMALDGEAFSAFIRKHPRYTGGIADIDAGTASVAGDPLDVAIARGKVEASDKPDIRTDAMKQLHQDDKASYAFPDKTREEMIVALAHHEGYVPGDYHQRGFAVAWDIKVRGDFSVKRADGFEFDEQFDEKWEQVVSSEQGYELFDEACCSALSQQLEGSYTPAHSDGVTAKFYRNGRQAGHLVLESWKATGDTSPTSMKFDSRNDYIEWLKELPDAELVDFYGLVRAMDADTASPAQSVAYELAGIREGLEEGWKSDAGIKP